MRVRRLLTRTALVDVDHLSQDSEEGEGVWIVKPPHLARGWDIFVTTNVNCILRHLQASPRLSVSRYITNPDLYHGYKYDLRFYVLISGAQVSGQVEHTWEV